MGGKAQVHFCSSVALLKPLINENILIWNFVPFSIKHIILRRYRESSQGSQTFQQTSADL